MSIRHIENVTIDGANRAFGGYIYSVDYEANFAEQPSVLKIYIVNETGSYNISKEDLTTIGSPVQIKIGTKMTLFMYPMSYSYEDSPAGKLLQVEYLDESIVFLDKVVVKLSEPSRFVGQNMEPLVESYENTIVLGSEDYSEVELSDTERDLIARGFPSANPDVFLVHAPITYTFGELIAQISDFINVIPVLDGPGAKYRKDFTGRLREVLSAWCNDLGLGFYWENRKLNFIDLRNPANLSAVKSLSDSIKEQNRVVNFNESFSLRDTFTRAIHGTNYENGRTDFMTTIGTGPDTNYYLRNIRITSIPWESPINGYLSDSGGRAAKRIKAAKYGLPFFIATQFIATDFIGEDIQDVFDASKIIMKRVGSETDTTKLAAITENTGITPGDFDWFAYSFVAESNLQDTFTAYKALADFYGRFYTIAIPSEERGKKLFGDDVRWYPQRKAVKDIAQIMAVLEPVAEKIANLQTLSLQQFLNNGFGNPALSDSQIKELTANNNLGSDGYIIKEVDPVWNPPKSDGVVNFGDYVIIEGDSQQSAFSKDSFTVFYFGQRKGVPQPLNPDNIQIPSVDLLLITSTNLDFIQADNPDVTAKSSKFLYRPPETANVNYCDLNRIDITEEIIDQFGSFDEAVTNEAAGIPQQIEPFFSSAITVPNIDLAGSVTPTLGTGLQGFSISYSDNGVKSTYTIGTEKMRLRNPDVFYRYVYDPRKKKQDIVAVPTISIKSRRTYNTLR
jgi:hypothetical protein